MKDHNGPTAYEIAQEHREAALKALELAKAQERKKQEKNRLTSINKRLCFY